jgi:competence protein ComEA
MKNYLRNYLTPSEQRLLYLLILVSFISIIAFNISSNYLYSDEVNQDSLLADIKDPYELSINIITASKDEMIQIKGLGPKTADKIIALRDTFEITSNKDLLLIKGIGEKTLAKWLPYLEKLKNDSLNNSGQEIILAKENSHSDKMNINLASIENLTKVKGIGVKKASLIYEFIQQNKGISDLNELLVIKGIGKKTLAKIEELFYVGS